MTCVPCCLVMVGDSTRGWGVIASLVKPSERREMRRHVVQPRHGTDEGHELRGEGGGGLSRYRGPTRDWSDAMLSKHSASAPMWKYGGGAGGGSERQPVFRARLTRDASVPWRYVAPASAIWWEARMTLGPRRGFAGADMIDAWW